MSRRASNDPMHPARREELAQLAKTLGHEFDDLALLDRALCHSSTGNEGRANYERLEFLGDAILGFVVADSLYHATPEIPEGDLTDRRARLVSRPPLAAVAERLQLETHLIGGRGLREQDRKSKRILADLVEATVAAIYLDGGVDAARRFVTEHIMKTVDGERPRSTERDPKSRLLHYTQVHDMGQPRYELEKTWGPDHERSFRVVVLVRDEPVATGVGRTKQAGEKCAAAAALELLQQRDQASGEHPGGSS